MPALEALCTRLEGIRRILLAHYEAGANFPSASKGNEREVLVREFLSQVFPSPYRFGSGAVIDAHGAQSGQLDIVVEFPFLPSFPTPGVRERLYLVESVGAVIEVKSNLQTQWRQVRKSTAKVRPLHRDWRAPASFTSQGGHSAVGQSMSRVPFLAVGFRGPSTPARLQKLLNECDEHERPDGLLVLDSGAYSGCPLCESTREGKGARGLMAILFR